MVAEQINARTQEWRFVGFVGRSEEYVGKRLGSSLIVGTDDWLIAQTRPVDVVVAIGQPRIRAEVACRLQSCEHLRFPNLIHPAVSLDANRIELGNGNLFTAGVALTCDIEIGDFNYLNLNATVGHDTRIGCFNVLNPGVNVSGQVVIGNEVLVGTGAQLLEGVRLGDGAVVGAGAVAVEDVPDGVTVVGIPARPLQRSTPVSD
jgi:sugar O-acyltransferase (sialic acid O-acetyltransferase NeuD family)